MKFYNNEEIEGDISKIRNEHSPSDLRELLRKMEGWWVVWKAGQMWRKAEKAKTSLK